MLSILFFLSSIIGFLLSAPPFYYWPLAFVFLVPLFILIKRKSGGFRIFFLFGIFYYTYHLWWLLFLTDVVPEVKYLLPLGLIVLVLIESALLGLIGYFIPSLIDRKYIFFIPFLFTGLEFFRTLGEISFPWAPFYLTQVKNLSGIQVIEWTGPFFLSFLIVLGNILLYLSLERKRWLILFFGLIIANQVYGNFRLRTNFTGSVVSVAVYQPNLNLALSFKEEIENGKKIYMELSSKAEETFMSIWSESALPGYLRYNEEVREFVSQFALKESTHLLMGSADYEFIKGKHRVYNTAFYISPSGKLKGSYNKIKLVPFGEALPYDEKFPFLKKIDFGEGDYSRGRRLEPFDLDGVKVGPLICYESIFPELSRKLVLRGAQVLVNMTSDGWFGKSLGPLEHRDLFVFRAVETRRFLLRSARMGISSIIDPFGRVLKEIPLFTQGIIIDKILVPSQEKITFYTKIGEIFGKISLFVLLIFVSLSFYYKLRSFLKDRI